VINHLAVPRAEHCAFCDYLNGVRPYTILERDDVVAALVTREQRGVGHVLMIPVAHRETILDLADLERVEIMRGIVRVATAIDQAYQRPGLAVWQNNGVPAHQKIPHAHFHVAGTLEGGTTYFGPVSELSVEDTDHIADRLRPFLPAKE
jgi:histidine triad (HIT) family protein